VPTYFDAAEARMVARNQYGMPGPKIQRGASVAGPLSRESPPRRILAGLV